MELARHMASRLPTRLVTFGYRDRREQSGALEIRVLGSPWHVRGQRANPFHPGLFSALGDADVVHCHQQHVLMSSVSAIWCRVRGKPCSSAISGGAGGTSRLSVHRWMVSRALARQRVQPADYRHDRVVGASHWRRSGPDRLSPEAELEGRRRYSSAAPAAQGSDDLIRGLPTGCR